MACQVTLAVGGRSGGHLPYLAHGCGDLTLVFGMPSAGGGRIEIKDGFLYTGSALDNPAKLVLFGYAEGVCGVVLGMGVTICGW